MKAILKKIAPFISILFFGLAIWFLDRELGQYRWDEITGYLTGIPPIYFVVSLFLSFLSYLLLTAYDVLGVEYIGEDLALGKTIRAGFIGYAFSHNMGMALITGGSIRYRIYSIWGLTGIQVTKIVAFSAFTLWIGFCATAGLSLVLAPPSLPEGVIVPYVSLRILGGILLVMVIGYMIASATVKNEWSFRSWRFTFPSFKMAMKQVGIASLDWLLACSVLYVLLPEAGVPFFSFLGVFLLAQIVGLFSQVPGGLGVFESIILLYLSNFMTGSNVIGILLVYRIIYYLIPLLVAMVILGYQEYKVNRQVVKDFGSRTASWFPRVVPLAFSISIFIGGTILLFSGALPSEIPRMQWLQSFIPLPVIEMSHFFASLVGAALLVLARGLQRRIDAAYHATVGLLIFGILFSLLKGVSYIEAGILLLMLIALIPSRQEFHRKASLFAQSFSPYWVSMILMVFFSSIWLGLFSYQNVEYQKELWWQFTLLGDAPRYLRASVAVLGFAVIFGLIKLLKPRYPELQEDIPYAYETAYKIMERSGRTQSNLLLLGDKRLLLSDEHDACIMYGVEDKSWISMGDPMGPKQEIEELIWKFRDLSEKNDGWPVFYQVHDRYLDLYRSLGHTLLKLGEEARIALPEFDLANKALSELQKDCKKLKKGGYEFELIPARRVASHLNELKEVSDAWLQIPGNHEKRFALGYFKDDYLTNFPIAVIKKDNKLQAFSNLWTTARKHEIGYDLIRFRPSIPPSLTDFILAESVLWGKERGYQRFNLGIAPLSEMDETKLEPKWAKFADQLYDYGGHLYNFKGLRHHKEKFNPRWEPLFLAAPAGLRLAAVLSHIAELISGHRRG
jgi:phosphatidylglycerol lysyltransferase